MRTSKNQIDQMTMSSPSAKPDIPRVLLVLLLLNCAVPFIKVLYLGTTKALVAAMIDMGITYMAVAGTKRLRLIAAAILTAGGVDGFSQIALIDMMSVAIFWPSMSLICGLWVLVRETKPGASRK